MIRRRLAPAIGVLLLWTPVSAYQMTSWVLSGGAHAIGSTSYQISATLSQPSPLGISGGTSYHLQHGFWHTVFGPPPAAPSLHITRLSATQAELWWYPVSGATSYHLYRGSSAHFAPGAPWQTVNAPGTSCTFTDGVGDPAVNYYFFARSAGTWGESNDSNRVGEFDFGSSAGVAKPPREAGQRR